MEEAYDNSELNNSASIFKPFDVNSNFTVDISTLFKPINVFSDIAAVLLELRSRLPHKPTVRQDFHLIGQREVSFVNSAQPKHESEKFCAHHISLHRPKICPGGNGGFTGHTKGFRIAKIGKSHIRQHPRGARIVLKNFCK